MVDFYRIPSHMVFSFACFLAASDSLHTASVFRSSPLKLRFVGFLSGCAGRTALNAYCRGRTETSEEGLGLSRRNSLWRLDYWEKLARKGEGKEKEP